MIYLTAGLMRTGSTFLYQIMSELALVNMGRAPRPEKITTEMVQSWMDEPGPVVIKQHRYDKTFTPALNSLRAVVCVRDPRDVAVSLMHFRGEDFHTILSSDALLGWMESYYSWMEVPDRITIRYESLLKDPISIIMLVSRYMACPVSEYMASYIARKWSKESNLDRSKQDNPLRSRHFFARRHIYSSEIGQWRELPHDQKRQLNNVVGGWVDELGY
jgi:hypothetical protein